MPDSISSRIVAAVRQVVPDGQAAALHEPEFRGREWDYVKSCIDDGWVSSAGTFVERFERELAKVSARKHAIACVNGTAALHLALLMGGIGPGDEVLVPALTFVATANSIHHCGAVPHFVDCEEDTLGLSPAALERHLASIAVLKDGRCTNRATGRTIKAVVPVHIYGHPVRMREICDIAERYGLLVIEDATEAIGSLCGGKPVGGDGQLSVLSFNGNKIVTTGGGGAVLTDDPALAARAKHVSSTAKLPHRWAFMHDEVGYNYRMPNINAALGCAQIERLGSFVARKRALAAVYDAAFRDVRGVRFFRERAGTESNYWLNAILLDYPDMSLRDEVLAALNDCGLQSRPAWTPMHLIPFNAGCPRGELPVTESIHARLINLPSSPRLADRL